MNRRQLTVLIILGVVLGALGYLAWKKQQSSYAASKVRMGERLLPDFPLNEVSHVRIQHATNQVNLVRQEEGWVVKERAGYAANFGNISDFLRKLWELKIAKPVRVGSSRLPHLELTRPQSGAGTLVEFRGSGDKVLETVVLGAKHTKQSSNPQFGDSSWPDGRYIMVGTNLETVALVSETFANIEPKPEDWLNKDFFKIEKIKSIAVTSTNATNNWKLARETETGEWKLAEVKGDEKLDTGKSSSVTSAFSYPSFNDVAADLKPPPAGFTNGTKALIETFDGFTYTINTENKPGGEDQYLHLNVAGSFTKQRTPGKDEKPEDKTKLDKEFADSLKKLEDKLKTEQKYTNWIYVVSKWTVDPILKPRKDLLEEKKDETKAGETNAPAPAAAVTPPAPKPADAKPAESKPAETKPAEAKPAENKAAETKPAEAKPAEPKPGEKPPTSR